MLFSFPYRLAYSLITAGSGSHTLPSPLPPIVSKKSEGPRSLRTIHRCNVDFRLKKGLIPLAILNNPLRHLLENRSELPNCPAVSHYNILFLRVTYIFPYSFHYLYVPSRNSFWHTPRTSMTSVFLPFPLPLSFVNTFCPLPHSLLWTVSRPAAEALFRNPATSCECPNPSWIPETSTSRKPVAYNLENLSKINLESDVDTLETRSAPLLLP